MSEVALAVRGVSKKFRKGELYDSLRDLIPALARAIVRQPRPEPLGEREFWALREVSFEVARGEAFGIIGANGAGKSTVLKILSGIMRPTTGEIAVRGRLSALIEVAAGFHPDLTGRENIFLYGAILGMTRADVRRRFDEIVAFSGLESFIDTPVKRYSTGMFARLGFSVASHVDPDVLIVDEVLSVGDLVFQRRCVQHMRNVISGGATVLFVSHNLRAVTELCQRALLLERGHVRVIGPSDEVVRSYTESLSERHHEATDKPVAITAVHLRGSAGEPRASYRTGEDVTLEAVITAREAVGRLSLVLAVYDESYGMVFNTSSERLGAPPIDFAAGEKVSMVIDLTLHLTPGTYRIDLYLHRYELQREYDHWASAATFHVSSDLDVRGIANLYPRLRIGTSVWP